MVQQHLTYKEMTDYGCFYTPQKFVDIVHLMLIKNVKKLEEYVLIDTSSGYGSFLNDCGGKYKCLKANDIDFQAVDIARQKKDADIIYYNKNALFNVGRKMFDIANNEKIIVIGNPPYNDTTSIVKGNLKNTAPCQIDENIKTRDLGISFLLSYNKLKADYIAVLHPLSYMIKFANFKLLKPFYDNYSVIDAVVINSQEFSRTSTGTGFPIVIVLYKRSGNTTYEDIKNRVWQTADGQEFCFNKDSIGNYISKYPNKNKKADGNSILFYTMRDINALKRSKTFITEPCNNAIIIDKNKFPYYCYVDIFKEYAERLPYYWGNYDVFIDNQEFKKIEDEFVCAVFVKYPFLRDKIKRRQKIKLPNKNVISCYFKKLLGENYVY